MQIQAGGCPPVVLSGAIMLPSAAVNGFRATRSKGLTVLGRWEGKGGVGSGVEASAAVPASPTNPTRLVVDDGLLLAGDSRLLSNLPAAAPAEPASSPDESLGEV